MTFAPRTRVLSRSGSFVLAAALASLISARSPEAAEATKQIRIKNARTIRVGFGKRREPAAAVRPDKDGRQLVLAPDLDGTSAELQDITPGVPGSRWVVPVSVDRGLLDTERFLPSHVYRVELRWERQILGSALVYLYPPPAQKTGRVDFGDEQDGKADKDGNNGDDKPSALASAPKGEL